MPRPAPRILEVLRTESVTPNMKRVVLGGGDLSDFPKNHESANFKLLIPRPGQTEIPLPPLRDRREDIPLLAAHFLHRHAAHYGQDVFEFESSSMQLLLEHAWPGNVRELEHAVERACLMANSTKVTIEDLGLRERPDGTARLEQMKLEEAERYLIQKALGRVDNNVSQAAEALGLSRSALYRRLQRFGLQVADD